MKQLNVTISNCSSYLCPQITERGARGNKVYFGTGLASSREESCGFGFELLGPVLAALVVMVELGADSVLHEIGTVGYSISNEQHDRLIEEQFNLIINMVQNLCIEDVYIVELSHSYHKQESFQNILQEVKEKLYQFMDMPNFRKFGEYTIIQIAQMKFLYNTENAKIKLGWIVGNNPVMDSVGIDQARLLIEKGNLNEYYFDNLYRYVFPNDTFSFVYTSAGMDVIDGKRYAPYTVTRSQNRPLLLEPISDYLSRIPETKHKRDALKFYEKNIVNNWERLFGEIDTYGFISKDEMLVYKLQYIQNRVLGINVA